MNSAKEILKHLISIDSQFNRSNKEIIDYIQKLFVNYESKIYSVDNSDIDLYNLVIKIPGEQSESPLVFVGHTDTVLFSEKWNRNPLIAEEENGKLYGLGASDMKSGIAIILSAVLNLNKKPTKDIYLVFDCDEEYGGKGGLDLIKKFSLKNANVIILEPTSRKIILGQKGCIDLEIETFGKALHASLVSPEKSEQFNANYKAVKIFMALKEYEKEIYLNSDEDYGHPTIALSYICGGSGAANVISDKCVIRLSRRLIPLENLNNYHIFAYPNIWEETSCISAIEAMSAGLYCIMTNYGALFETCAEFPIYINYVKDYKILAEAFAAGIDIAAETLHEKTIQDHLDVQQDFYKRFYNWHKKGNEWNCFLQGVIASTKK